MSISEEGEDSYSTLQRAVLKSLGSYSVDALKHTSEGSRARAMLFDLGIETVTLDFTGVSTSRVEDHDRFFLTAPDRDSVGEFAPEIDWLPKAEYSTHDTDGTKVVVESSLLLPGKGTARAEASVDNLSELSPDALPERCFTELDEKIDEITRTTASHQEAAQQQWVRNRRERIIEKREKLENRAEALLHDARSALLAWALVALVEEGKVLPNKSLEKGTDFLSEAQKLWESFCKRRRSESNVSMVGIGESAGVPPPVTEAAEFGMRAVYEELSAIDEKFLTLSVEALACEIVEDRIIQGKLESSEATNPGEQKPWAGRETTDYAVDLLHTYADEAEYVQNITTDLWKLLEKAGYPPEKTQDRLRSIKRALKKDWEDENPHDFMRKLASALEEVGELPDDTRMTLHDTL